MRLIVSNFSEFQPHLRLTYCFHYYLVQNVKILLIVTFYHLISFTPFVITTTLHLLYDV